MLLIDVLNDSFISAICQRMINGSVNVVILFSGSGGQIGFIQKGKFQF